MSERAPRALSVVRTPDARLVAFGRAVRRARRDRDMSQEALGRAAGLATKHVSEIERANRDVRLTTLIRLLDALDPGPDEAAAFWREAVGLRPSRPVR